MDINEIKILLAVYAGNEELVLKNAGGNKLSSTNDYFVVADDGSCHLFGTNGIEKDISAITALSEDIVLRDIKKIVIPSCVTSIGNGAFSNCTSLTSVAIPSSVTSIGIVAFFGCTSLMSVTIPGSVASIKNYTFEFCSSLTSVAISNGVMSIGNNAFFGCTSLMSVTIPDSVTSIGNGAFYNCTSLMSMAIPDSITSIGNLAFKSCSKLVNLSFKGKTLAQVKAMKHYPWGIEDESVINCSDGNTYCRMTSVSLFLREAI